MSALAGFMVALRQFKDGKNPHLSPQIQRVRIDSLRYTRLTESPGYITIHHNHGCNEAHFEVENCVIGHSGILTCWHV
jgi:hypothetical protein